MAVTELSTVSDSALCQHSYTLSEREQQEELMLETRQHLAIVTTTNEASSAASETFCQASKKQVADADLQAEGRQGILQHQPLLHAALGARP